MSISSKASFYHVNGSDNYNLRFSEHSSYEGNSLRIAEHRWTNKKNSKLMITAPGYGENCGYFKPLHEWLIANGYNVLCLELPGHGESGGMKYDIDDFKTYGKIAKEIISEQSFSDTSFIGHSTGTVGVAQNLFQNNDLGLKNIVFLAPLVRSNFWKLTVLSLRALGGKDVMLPRRVPPRSKAYRSIKNMDEKYSNKIPSHWARELVKWNKDLKNVKNIQTKINILFGSKDDVLDLKFSSNFYKKRLSNGNVTIIKNFKHRFFYKEGELNENFYKWLKESLL